MGPWRSRRRLTLAGLVIVFGVVLVGPWPTYGARDLESWPGLASSLDQLARNASRSQIGSDPGPLEAGWAQAPIDLPESVPLAGYGKREGRPSEGRRSRVRVKALVLRDAADTVAVLSGDVLIIPENVAVPVRLALAERLGWRSDNVLFSATHTHSGPGGFAPGWLARQFAGNFDVRVEQALIDAFVAAAVEASQALRPARLGSGRVAAADLVMNRTRPGAVDADLQFMRFENDAGAACALVSFAAHATLLGPENMRLGGDYPGSLERELERDVDLALFVAGAVGSMGPRGQARGDAPEQLGQSLAARVRGAWGGLELTDRAEIASTGVAFEMPPVQARITRGLRFSPVLADLMGLNRSAWIGGLRVGDHVLVGFPGDFSGELSVELKQTARAAGIDLWLLSFNGDYVGYISPDRYYWTAARSDKQGYEVWTMGWFGPQQAELLTRLAERTTQELMATRPEPAAQAGGRTLLH